MSYANPAAPTAGQSFHRPILVALLAIIVGFVGVIVLIAGLFLAAGLGFFGGAVFGVGGALVGVALGMVVAAVGGVTLAAGLGLWNLRAWAWWLATIIVFIDFLVSGIVGKVLLGLLLIYLVVVKKYFNH